MSDGAVRATSPPVPRGVLAAYAAPAFSQTLVHGPTGSVIQGVYAKSFGIPLATVAAVLLIASVVDAVANPAVGYLSDRHRARGGSRVAWLVGGSIASAVACWFLFAPAGNVGATYFGGWLIFAFVGWAIAEVPYSAWLAEITTDYNERTRLATWRGVAMYGGAIAFAAIPYLPFLSTTEFNLESLRWTALLAVIALPSFALLAATIVPRGAPAIAPRSTQNVWRGIFGNRPLLVFALLFLLYHLSPGILTGLLFFYLDGHLHQGAFMAGLMLLTLPLGALAVPVWGWACRRFGKQRAWAAGVAGAALVGLLYALVPVGPDGRVMLVLVQFSMILLYAGFPVAAPSMLADVIDYGRLRFGVDYAGTYFSIYNVMYKAMPGIGAAIGLSLVGLWGFDPGAAHQTTAATTGLLVSFCVIPAALLAIVAPMLWFFPIDARRQRIIAARLRQRDERAARLPTARTAS